MTFFKTVPDKKWGYLKNKKRKRIRYFITMLYAVTVRPALLLLYISIYTFQSKLVYHAYFYYITRLPCSRATPLYLNRYLNGS